MPTSSSTSHVTRATTARLARFREAGIFLFLAAIVAGVGIKEPRFLTPDNLRSILLDLPLLVVVAIGMTCVIVSRNIDLSAGSILGLCGIVAGMQFKRDPAFSIPFAFALAVTLGMLLGAANGLFVTLFRVPAIIVTIGTLSVFRGMAFMASGGKQVDPNDIPKPLIELSQTGPLGFPALVLIALLLAVVFHAFLRSHRLGRRLYAIGGNPDAARLAGIGVSRAVMGVFVLSGGLCGLAGLMYASRFGVVNPAQTGVGFELSVIAATVIGGTDVFGGSGGIPGTVLGCLLLAVLGNALAVLGLSATWQLAVYGAILLVAVWSDSAIRGRLGHASLESAY